MREVPTKPAHTGKKRQRSHAGQKQATPSKRPPGARLLWLAAILVATFVAYLPSLDNGFTNWDDDKYILNNPLLANPDAGTIFTKSFASNYHPLTIWSFVLKYRLSGLNPVSYH